MTKDSRVRKRLYASAIALGLALGSVGIAAAATSGGSAPAADEGPEVSEPAYVGSIVAPAEDETLSEADEAGALRGLATLTADDAAAAASAQVAGTVGDVELDNENGYVVYSVEITDESGAEIDVKVDAGDGSILDQQADDGTEDADELEADDAAEESEASIEADDDNVEHENEHEGQNDPDEGHQD